MPRGLAADAEKIIQQKSSLAEEVYNPSRNLAWNLA